MGMEVNPTLSKLLHSVSVSGHHYSVVSFLRGKTPVSIEQEAGYAPGLVVTLWRIQSSASAVIGISFLGLQPIFY